MRYFHIMLNLLLQLIKYFAIVVLLMGYIIDLCTKNVKNLLYLVPVFDLGK